MNCLLPPESSKLVFAIVIIFFLVSATSNFSVKSKGYNYETLNKWADSLKIELLKNTKVQNVTIKEGNSAWNRKPTYEYNFSLAKEWLTLLNIESNKKLNV